MYHLEATSGLHREKVTRGLRVVATQKEAIEIATKIAKNQGSELTIQGKDGRIRDKRSYGNDPYPPKG